MTSITDTIKMQWDLLTDKARAHIRTTRPALLTQWDLWEAGYQYATITASSAAAALATAESNVDRGNYDRDLDPGDQGATLYIDVMVRNAVTGEQQTTTVTLHPEEPDCEDSHEHDWRSPVSVVGGCRESPGVWGHGGGVKIREVCSHCGRYRITDTWAQRKDTGEQGLTEVWFEPADVASAAWVEHIDG
jgi:hypothetical protein